MDRRTFLTTTGAGSASLLLGNMITNSLNTLNIGMIGLDTSHSTAFTKIINEQYAGFRVSHAFPFGSQTIASSYSRIPRYTEEVKSYGVEIVDTIETLLDQVDAVLLETNDGRLHLAQAQQVFRAGKMVFIDKPLAASLHDVITIFNLAEQADVPIFSSSSLRFSPTTVAVQQGAIGEVIGADIYSPAKLEPTHPDLFWYGIHGIESLFTVMGPGCQAVQRTYTPDADVVVGKWADGRIGTFRGLRAGKSGYGGTAYGTTGISPAGVYEGYEHLVKEILAFFKSGHPPVSKEETIEIFKFMDAAERSKEEGGKWVEVSY